MRNKHAKRREFSLSCEIANDMVAARRMDADGEYSESYVGAVEAVQDAFIQAFEGRTIKGQWNPSGRRVIVEVNDVLTERGQIEVLVFTTDPIDEDLVGDFVDALERVFDDAHKDAYQHAIGGEWVLYDSLPQIDVEEL